jgi:hypothetical protein
MGVDVIPLLVLVVPQPVHLAHIFRRRMELHLYVVLRHGRELVEKSQRPVIHRPCYRSPDIDDPDAVRLRMIQILFALLLGHVPAETPHGSRRCGVHMRHEGSRIGDGAVVRQSQVFEDLVEVSFAHVVHVLPELVVEGEDQLGLESLFHGDIDAVDIGQDLLLV